jgi:hypothetical protein
MWANTWATVGIAGRTTYHAFDEIIHRIGNIVFGRLDEGRVGLCSDQLVFRGNVGVGVIFDPRHRAPRIHLDLVLLRGRDRLLHSLSTRLTLRVLADIPTFVPDHQDDAFGALSPVIELARVGHRIG